MLPQFNCTTGQEMFQRHHSSSLKWQTIFQASFENWFLKINRSDFHQIVCHMVDIWSFSIGQNRTYQVSLIGMNKLHDYNICFCFGTLWVRLNRLRNRYPWTLNLKLRLPHISSTILSNDQHNYQIWFLYRCEEEAASETFRITVHSHIQCFVDFKLIFALAYTS